MKANIFMPKYMADFKCIGSECNDTCCAGWDINIDEDSYNKYINSTGDLKSLVDGKFIKSKCEDDFFNFGFMKLREEMRCPFLNDSMLCDIHGNVGEENLCITCKSYPRVYNMVDDVYEKSGIPSCEELSYIALLNKNKMEFIEVEDEINEEEIEIRRFIDTESFEGTDSLLQYFWDIRVSSINIMQNRNYSIDDRLSLLKDYYSKLEKYKIQDDFDKIEDLIDNINSDASNLNILSIVENEKSLDFYNSICSSDLIDNIKSKRLKEVVLEYRGNSNNESTVFSKDSTLKNNKLKELDNYSYIFENYLVNQIFKDLIPFNKGNDLNLSIDYLINSYSIIKAYICGISINTNTDINEGLIIRVIQTLSKDIEHNKVFKNILENKRWR